jgi:hypothetical protein
MSAWAYRVPPPIDHAGHEIEVGDTVAYNWSGDIAMGIVTSRGSSGRGPFVIQQLIPGKQTNPSRVSSPRSILVLQKADGTEPR